MRKHQGKLSMLNRYHTESETSLRQSSFINQKKQQKFYQMISEVIRFMNSLGL